MDIFWGLFLKNIVIATNKYHKYIDVMSSSRTDSRLIPWVLIPSGLHSVKDFFKSYIINKSTHTTLSIVTIIKIISITLLLKISVVLLKFNWNGSLTLWLTNANNNEHWITKIITINMITEVPDENTSSNINGILNSRNI